MISQTLLLILNIFSRLPKCLEQRADIVTGADVGYSYTTIALFILLAAGSGLLIFMRRSRSASMKPAGRLEPHEHTVAATASNPKQSDLPAQIKQHIDADPLAIPLNEDIEGSSMNIETLRGFCAR